LAHGAYARGGFYLLLEDEIGNLQACSDDEIVAFWELQNLRLIFLVPFQKVVGRDPRPHLMNFILKLSEAGVAGVVAMQDSICLRDMKSFTESFYGSLLQGSKIDEAANHGRALLLQRQGAWCVPTVMTRLSDGAVWPKSVSRTASSISPISFVSYSREDSEFALRLSGDLIAAGVPVWLDKLHIAAGQRWDKAIELALANCPRILLILSSAAVESENVLDEVSFAIEEKKKSFPCFAKIAQYLFACADFNALTSD
jgi:hypothetical protein